jgi:uncharacterized protein
MNDPGVLVSVRGEARMTVPPDSAVIAGTIAATGGSKAEAVPAAAAALDSLTADLAAIGGLPMGVDTLRRPLTWSAHSTATIDEHVYDKTTGQHGPTGKVTATVALVITVRAFDMLDALGSHFGAHEAFSVHEVSWHVDWDNPGWRDVRAAAIQAAIAKGRDYAGALGGRLSAVEHIADPGLIGGDDRQHWVGTGGRSVGFASSGGTNVAPSLDPVPQELTALIEARFTATGVSLTQDAAAIAQGQTTQTAGAVDDSAGWR